jgi:iron complex transport system substrate-binding protein
MPRLTPHLVMSLAVVFAVAACGDELSPRRASEESDSRLTLTDDEGVPTTLDSAPERIVTFAPSHTEIVFALGLGDRLVGVSGEFDDYPSEARDVERIGGANGVEPNIEKVVALEPDVLLTAFIGGEWKERLRQLGVPVFTTLAASFQDTLADIESLGRLLGVAEQAREVTADVAARAGQTEQRLGGLPKVSCFLDLSDLFTVGPGSLEYDLMQRAGCDPVTGTSDDPYPQWSLEQLVQDDPDVYLVSEGVTPQQLSRQPGIRDLAAVRAGRVHQVDGDLISRPGPRVAEGIEALAQALHGLDADAA